MKKLIATLTLIITLFSVFNVTAFASTSGTTNTRTITVTTKSNYWLPGSSSITLKQNKGTFYYKGLFGKKKKGQCYGYYNVKATPIAGYAKDKKKKAITTTFTGRSKTIKLKKDSTYSITVSYDSNGTWLQSGCKLSSWDTTPNWWVNSTYKVSSCY